MLHVAENGKARSRIPFPSAATNAAHPLPCVRHRRATRKAADHWLQNFRNSAGAWQLCVALLARPGLADYEYHFAAHSLRLACSKVPVRGLREGLA